MAHPTWALGTHPYLPAVPGAPGPRIRVVVDNDFSGDPDDLFQVAHHVLSPSVEVVGVIGSHLRPGDALDPGPGTARNAVRRVTELFDAMGIDAGDRIWLGSDAPLDDRGIPQDSPAARALVAEAMRDDPRPLYVCCGGGLTDVASAWLLEPRIAQRLTVLWIGGPEYAGTREPPGVQNPEYNLAIDVTAGQVVFNDSDLPLWQVPRDVYRQCLVSDAELRRRVAPQGAAGAFLYESLQVVARFMWESGAGLAETYALGDSPLVLLTALQSFFQADPSSSDYVMVPAPSFDEAGEATPRPGGRPIRVYTRVDTRLMFEDMFSKLEAFAEWRGA